MLFSESHVRDWVGPSTYRQALEAVPHVTQAAWGEAGRPGDLVATAQVQDPLRAVDTTLYWMRGALRSTCSCVTRTQCRHAAALALVVLAEAARPPAAPAPAANWEERLAAFTAPAPAAGAARASFVYRLRWPAGPTGDPELQIQVSHGSSPTFQALAWHLYRVGADDPEPDQLIEPVIRRIRARRPLYRDGATRTAASWLVVPDDHLDELLPRLGLHPRIEDEQRRQLVIHATLTLQPGLRFEEGPGGPRLLPVVTGPAGPIDRAAMTRLGPPGARWALGNGEAFRLGAAAEAAWLDDAPILVPEGERQAFEHRWLPTLATAGVLMGAAAPTIDEWPPGTPRPELLLSETEDKLLVEAGFLYGESRVEAAAPGTEVPGLAGPPGGPFVRRDAAAESAWLEALSRVLPVPLLRGEAAIAFLAETCPALASAGWVIVGEERLQAHRLATAKPVGHLRVTTGADWFDLHSELILGAETVRWPELQRALEKGLRYVRLGSGEWTRLPAEWLAAQRRLRERLGAEGDEAARAERHQALMIAEALEEAESTRVDAGWEDFRARLESFGGIAEVPMSPGFTGTLRPYQRQGFSYMAFLRDYGLHGILADDMGLGKTVQAAALLAMNHPNAQGPSLIVAPASVVVNWQQELRRFVPGLRVLVLHGPDRRLEAIEDHDLIITTYATARLDLEAHRARTYHTLILDEAQVIKNPRSQTARAMRKLRARHRLCLTGTPVENDLSELWSLFAFLMPGLLGDEAGFHTAYAQPIALGDTAAREALRKRIAPFILRRMKAHVAPELPERTDITVYCELAPGQRRAYDMLLSGARDRIQTSIARRGVERSRITILDALLKLRQACCHPALLGTTETLALESGKLEAAMALIAELTANGHRALVFSQFTQMLAILRDRLESEGIAYEYLDGRTRDRQARVDRFNASDTPLFLISLKAGGTGLNLTGADYVIHYDPWWNPASEDQATDRAHRIGQTRPVFNYKLVARDTIEEKLVALQAWKRGMVRDLLETDVAGKVLTAEDVEALFG